MPRFSDSGGILGAGLREQVPTRRPFDVAFRSYRTVGFHDIEISESNSAARVLAVYAS